MFSYSSACSAELYATAHYRTAGHQPVRLREAWLNDGMSHISHGGGGTCRYNASTEINDAPAYAPVPL